MSPRTGIEARLTLVSAGVYEFEDCFWIIRERQRWRWVHAHQPSVGGGPWRTYKRDACRDLEKFLERHSRIP